jgi:hypothetical protein
VTIATSRLLAALFVALLCGLTGRTIQAQDKKLPPVPVKTEMQWKGSVDDETLMKSAPEDYISNAKAFEALWKAWKIGDKIPEVDFKTTLVLVQTTRGSALRVNASLDDKGDLKAVGLATRDLRPGFRYVLISVKKDGVKTVNGKPLKD